MVESTKNTIRKPCHENLQICYSGSSVAHDLVPLLMAHGGYYSFLHEPPTPDCVKIDRHKKGALLGKTSEQKIVHPLGGKI